MDEQWKVIPGFDEYEISNIGRVKSKPKLIRNGNGYYISKEIIMKPIISKGYHLVSLRCGDSKKKIYVHRLVAMAFIPNPENKPFINHKDNNPQNNNVDNLEWCTPKENTQWMIKQNRNKRTKEWLDNLHKSQRGTYKAVKGINMITGEVIVFENLNSVKTKGFQPSCVCNCCKGTRKSHAGYLWEYMEGTAWHPQS
jgi:hypothetical protein